MQRFRRSSKDVTMPSASGRKDVNVVKIREERQSRAPPVPEEPPLDSPKPSGEPAFAPDAATEHHQLDHDSEFWHVYADEGTIGKGSFAKVKKVRHLDSGEAFAVKILDKQSEHIDFSDLVREVTLLSSLRHPNIVRLFAAYEGPVRLFLVMELAEGGEFMQRLGEDDKTHSEESVRRHVRTLVEAVAYMHRNHFAHRDLKPANVLLSDASPDAEIKIIDFGLSRTFDADESKKMRTVCGSHAYLSPELVQMDRGKISGYGKEVDMWGIGLMAFIMLFGFNPFSRDTQMRTHDAIAKLEWSFPKGVAVTEEAKDFIKHLMTANVKRRLTAEQALDAQWLSKVDLGERSSKELSDLDVSVKKKLFQFNAFERMKRMVKTPHRRVGDEASPRPTPEQTPQKEERGLHLAAIPAWGAGR